MPTRTAEAVWSGTIGAGAGELSVESGTFEGTYSAGTRFEGEPGTNPEELMAAAHAGCFAMALSAILTGEGYEPETIDAAAAVTVEKVDDDWTITRIDLTVEASVPDLDADDFAGFAQAAKENCPVSRAYAGVETITLDASLA